ncbi:MAG: hypothetical protein IJ537_06180 [Bacteroidaceae bacterium]|nr:hypothetical protein [Bacteroidaceae bacterium]
MEENMDLTAERSLEIITEQLEKSRRAVSKDTGEWLFVSGLTTMMTALVVASANLLSWTPLFHLLWFALPVVIWLVMKRINRNRVPVPENFVGTLVRKTWYTTLAFALVYVVIATVWNIVLQHYESPEVFLHAGMHITPTILTLLAVAVSMTGLILKKSALVWFGLLSFVILRFGLFSVMISRLLPPDVLGRLSLVRPCELIFLFALVGLMLPGWMLKASPQPSPKGKGEN